MLTNMTIQEEKLGFIVDGMRYYRRNDAYYKAQNPSDKQIKITKREFIEASKRRRT